MPPPPSHAPQRLPALTSLRFFAAVAVIFVHFSHPAGWWLPLRRWAAHGSQGVPLFFLLSGFVLAYNYFPQARAGGFNSHDFWVARFARIYPMYLLALLWMTPWVRMDVAVGAVTPRWAVGSGLLSLFMVQSWVPSATFLWNRAGWTLAVEAVFYLLFPLALALSRSQRRTALALAALGLLAAPAVATWSYLPPLWLPLFLAGMALARLHELDLAPRLRPRLATPVALACLILLGQPFGSMAQLSLPEVALFALLVWSLAAGRGFCARALAHPWLESLGEASYALYIVQFPLWVSMRSVWLRPLRWGWLPHSWGFDGLPFFFTSLAVAIAFSLAANRWLETPLRIAIRRRWGAPRPSALRSAAAQSRAS